MAALLTWNLVQRAAAAPRQNGLVPVVVAGADIPVRTQVTPEMLQVKQVAADARHPKAFTTLEQLNGKVTNLPIAAGEQVLETKFFARKEDSGLAFRIQPGKRAVSVTVNEVISTGGLIVPGDFVDVVSIYTDGQGDGAAIVLQNIEVLAVAQSIQGPGEPGGSTLPGGLGPSKPADPRQEAVARPNARTATLAVIPEEAQRLILAEEKGKIRLALRAVDDHDPVSVPATYVNR
jgi:pilus assembly protein CpaB